ncbi:MAG: hypothetical protein J1E39_08900 [Eubacterium sp.]|nr:hypothetical protein [Eubacterium sp.]
MEYFGKTGRQPFAKQLLVGFLYMLLGNVLCTIMTISTAAFISMDMIKVVVVLLAFIIFYSLIFTVGYKDGDREQKYVNLHKAEPPDMHKWVKIGIILTLIMYIPSILLIINKLSGIEFDMLLVYRFADGLVYALALLLIPDNTIDSMNVAVPFVFMLCYSLIPVAAHLGYYFGYTQKLDKDKIMYN